MRRYEVVFVLAPTLTEEDVDEQVETYSKVAADMGAEVVDVDKWGKRRLAFPVQKHREGYYTVLTLDETGAEAITELERRFKVSEPVIRFLAVRIDQELKRAQKFERRKEARQKRRSKARSAKPSETSSEMESDKE